ncbi:MAG: hypothetical protein IPG49_14700 [Proteobacteria bacterium]|nr:hypothetical protein [Pseudomonadota bacterium]
MPVDLRAQFVGARAHGLRASAAADVLPIEAAIIGDIAQQNPIHFIQAYPQPPQRRVAQRIGHGLAHDARQVQRGGLVQLHVGQRGVLFPQQLPSGRSQAPVGLRRQLTQQQAQRGRGSLRIGDQRAQRLQRLSCLLRLRGIRRRIDKIQQSRTQVVMQVAIDPLPLRSGGMLPRLVLQLLVLG